MRYHPDSDPYVSDARPGTWQRRLCAAAIVITLALFCLCALPGCLGAPVAIRTIEGKELQLSQEINWLTGTRLTVSGKDVKTYVQGQTSSPVAVVSGSGASDTVHVKSNGLGAATGDSLSQPETPGASAPEPGNKNRIVGSPPENPSATAPAGKTLSPPTE